MQGDKTSPCFRDSVAKYKTLISVLCIKLRFLCGKNTLSDLREKLLHPLRLNTHAIYLHSTEHQNTKTPYICFMNTQTILVFLLFAVALIYVGRLVYKSLQVKKDGCGGNCKCGVDFSDIKPAKK